MQIQDTFVVNFIKTALDEILSEPHLQEEDDLHEQVSSYITDMYFGTGLIIDDSIEGIQKIIDYIGSNKIRTKLEVTDSTDRDCPDSFNMKLTVYVLDVSFEFVVSTQIRRKYPSVFV